MLQRCPSSPTIHVIYCLIIHISQGTSQIVLLRLFQKLSTWGVGHLWADNYLCHTYRSSNGWDNIALIAHRRQEHSLTNTNGVRVSADLVVVLFVPADKQVGYCGLIRSSRVFGLIQ